MFENVCVYIYYIHTYAFQRKQLSAIKYAGVVSRYKGLFLR